MCAYSQVPFVITPAELFAQLFSQESGQEHLAMIYYAYLDDSADRFREKVVVAGAIMGQKEKWNVLVGSWRKRLDEDQIEYFKSSHCETLNGQFHKFRAMGIEEGKKKALAIRDDLYQIVRASGVVGVGVTLSVATHATMRSNPAKFGSVPEVPYRLAFQQVIAECGKTMKLLGRGNIVTFAHDDGDDFDSLRDIYVRFKNANPDYHGVIADFIPLDDKTHPEVQAADVVSFVTYDHAKTYRSEPNLGNLKRLQHSMYKIVNWLDDPIPCLNMRAANSPAKATYVA